MNLRCYKSYFTTIEQLMNSLMWKSIVEGNDIKEDRVVRRTLQYYLLYFYQRICKIHCANLNQIPATKQLREFKEYL
jgi:hypothetical protein